MARRLEYCVVIGVIVKEVYYLFRTEPAIKDPCVSGIEISGICWLVVVSWVEPYVLLVLGPWLCMGG